ncbi:MAG: hypothetical protein CL569_04650 [Alphaproteobacteria bacterium]|nr:hypothetical protein [Alphaproteobacteria bacterium]|tara:strand:+ start:3304 stop:4647 length:1344 start_codon:yes stop_codon:yes gene_type:complete
MFCTRLISSLFLATVGIIGVLLVEIVQARTTVRVDDDGTVVFWTRAKLCGPGLKNLQHPLSSNSLESRLKNIEESLEDEWNRAVAELMPCSNVRFDFTLQASDRCDTVAPPQNKTTAHGMYSDMVEKQPGWDTLYMADDRPGVYTRAFVMGTDLGSDQFVYLGGSEDLEDLFGGAARTFLHETTHLMGMRDRYDDTHDLLGRVTGYDCHRGWEGTVGCDGRRFKLEQFQELVDNVSNSRFGDATEDFFAQSCAVRHIAMDSFNVQMKPPVGLSARHGNIYVGGRFTVAEYADASNRVSGEGEMYFINISPEIEEAPPHERWRVVGVKPGSFSIKGKLKNKCNLDETPENCRVELEFGLVGGMLDQLHTINEYTNLKSGLVQEIPQFVAHTTLWQAGFYVPFETELGGGHGSRIAEYYIDWEWGIGSGLLRFVDPDKHSAPSPFTPSP